MKTTNIFKVLLLAIITLSLSSCVEDKDYTIPNVNEVESPNLKANFSLKKAQDAVKANNSKMVNFDDISGGSELILEGYIISSDEAGNIYKQIYIQDKPENPTAGVRINVDKTDLYTFYEVGRKVYVKLSGLGIKLSNGVYEIGKIGVSSLDRIPSAEYKNYIVRDNVVETIVPTVITIGEIEDANVATLVMLENMQAKAKDLTYANLNDTYTVNRSFVSCANEETIIMRNSGFSDFKGQEIPNKSGTITAILGRYSTKKNKTNQLFIRTTDDIDFTQNRCDALFEEYFESAIGDISLTGWTNYAEAGSKVWEAYKDLYSLGVSAKIGAYQSGDASNVAWLITPAIDLDGQDNEVLTFKTSNSYADTSVLEVLISTDWDGQEANVASATWTTLPATIVDSSVYYKDWVESGDVDLSSYTGTAYIAFKYTGSQSTNNDGTYELDDIKIEYN